MATNDWRVLVAVENASGVPVVGARVKVSHQAGSGVTQQLNEVSLPGATLAFDVPDDTERIVCELRHDRYAALQMLLVRSRGETIWRWDKPTRHVGTSGRDVAVIATLGRVRPAPEGQIPEADLLRRAAPLQPALERALQANRAAVDKGKPATQPMFAPLDFDHRNVLVVPVQPPGATLYRLQSDPAVQAPIGDFHTATPDLLSDTPDTPGWRRFRHTTRPIDPSLEGRLHFVEYGEVGANHSAGPRFLVGVWVPHRLRDPAVRALDFVIWLHPNEKSILYPRVEAPFPPPYPYGIAAAMGDKGRAVATQPFLDLPVYHLFKNHYIAYQLAAARRDAVIVIPVAPGNHFVPFESPAMLMRLLRELCLFLPQDFPPGVEAAVHPPAPAVRRVAVCSFSSSVPRLQPLMKAALPDSRYPSPLWWATSSGPLEERGLDDATDFNKVWKEQWAIDGIEAGFQTYVDAAATWVLQADDRRLRIYKSTFTGAWDPRAPRKGSWNKLIKGAKVVTRRSGDLWAVSVGDAPGRLFALSLDKGFVLGPPSGPDAAMEPVLRPIDPHTMMPRICFGHAAVTSGLAAAP
ncbi:hypothetical protein ACTMTU_35310 [Streptomyces sp. OZ13]|uniref:hypothetical protein n=1 Tax=Streptomyces sp. OZ13 TaxID=3452210 RepID=UPI003F8ABAF0